MSDPDVNFDVILGDCPFPNCGLPYWLENQQLMKSSDPTGAVIVAFYRCFAGHHWPEPVGAGVPDDWTEEEDE